MPERGSKFDCANATAGTRQAIKARARIMEVSFVERDLPQVDRLIHDSDHVRGTRLTPSGIAGPHMRVPSRGVGISPGRPNPPCSFRATWNDSSDAAPRRRLGSDPATRSRGFDPG